MKEERGGGAKERESERGKREKGVGVRDRAGRGREKYLQRDASEDEVVRKREMEREREGGMMER